MWQQFTGDQDTPLGKAQALMYRAFGEPDDERRVQLAKEALEICPTAPMLTSCWPNTPADARRPCACTNKG
jgi:hypothetical protein